MTLPRYHKIESIITNFINNLVSEKDSLSALDRLNVRGTFDFRNFTRQIYIGYDYDSQEWIQFYKVF